MAKKTVSAWLSMDAPDRVYIAQGAQEDDVCLPWIRFKRLSKEGMSGPLMRMWAQKLRTFADEMEKLAEAMK